MKVNINTFDGLIETETIGDLIDLYNHKCFYNRGHWDKKSIVLTEYTSGFCLGYGKTKKEALKHFLFKIKDIEPDKISARIKKVVDNAIAEYGIANGGTA